MPVIANDAAAARLVSFAMNQVFTSNRVTRFRKALASTRPKEADVSISWESAAMTHESFHARYPIAWNGTRQHIFQGGKTTGKDRSLATEKPRYIMPAGRQRVYSQTPEYIAFQRKLRDLKNERMPSTLNEDTQFTTDGCLPDSDTLCTMPGVLQKPITYVPMDNIALRESLGLPGKLNDFQVGIADRLFDLLLSKAKAAPLNVPQQTSSGPPYMAVGDGYKIRLARLILQPDPSDQPVSVRNWMDLLKKIGAYDHKSLALDYHAAILFITQRRLQQDSFKKQRYYSDLENALSGGAVGKLKPIDKSVVVDGVQYDDFAAERVRIVMSGCWAVAISLQVCATPILSALFACYPMTFHINTSDQLRDAVNGWHISFSDVTQFDSTFPWQLILCFQRAISKYWGDDVANAWLAVVSAPYYARPVVMGQKEGVWVGDPFGSEPQFKAGNRSGEAFTTLLNKCAGTYHSLCIILAAFGCVTLEDFDANYGTDWFASVLDRTHPEAAIINNGDDIGLLAKSADLLARMKAAQADFKSCVFKSEPEAGQQYNGMLIIPTDLPNLLYSVVINTGRAAARIVIPERDFDSPFKSHPAAGLHARILRLASDPTGLRMLDCFRDAWDATLAPKFGSWAAMLLQLKDSAAAIMPNLDTVNLTELDLRVLANPDLLHHSVEAADLSPGVLDMLGIKKVPLETVRAYLHQAFKGEILTTQPAD